MCINYSFHITQPKPEPWPAKPIVFINPLAAGGPQEVETRLYAQKMMENTGWKILVDFRVGAGGTLGQNYVVKSPPDGYTVLTTSSSYVITPALYPDLPYNLLRDFAAVTLIGIMPNILVVPPDVPAKDIKELISHSTTQVKDGVDLVNRAGSSLTEIVASIEKVTTIVAASGP